MKVIDIKTPDNIDEYWKKKIEDYCAEHITEKTEPHKYLNYQKENLNIEKHLYFSALYDGEQLVCFSGIYNGGRYSPWIHRILNRTYLVPAYRTTTFKKKETYYSTEYIASHQLKLWNDPQILFISMQEHRRSQRTFSFLHKTIKGFENQVWTDVAGFAQVVQGDEQNCFQKVSYSNFSLNEKLEFDLPIISEEEYKKRFL